jgi:hypothetical protein
MKNLIAIPFKVAIHLMTISNKILSRRVFKVKKCVKVCRMNLTLNLKILLFKIINHLHLIKEKVLKQKMKLILWIISRNRVFINQE